jgi:hypothetical protein
VQIQNGGVLTAPGCGFLQRKWPRHFGRGQKILTADLDINAGAPLSPNFHVWFTDTALLLNDHIFVTDTPADRYISVSGALLATQRANTVSVAYFGGACG